MTINKHSEGIITVELPPEPDIRAELDRLMEELRNGPECDVVIDFDKVDVMTSLTLSGFLKVRELLIEFGRRLIFVNCSSITKDIFTVTCFDGIFEFAEDTEAALAALAGKQAEQPA